ncbi:MAG: hypothetical protein J5I94_27775 [Phaeodactylibacter sp.]|nr:hypothetical protein [Phaeodactylibacter sp.]
MQKTLFVGLLMAAGSFSLNAQPIDTEKVVKEKMQALSWLVGEWEGEGLVVLPDGQTAPSKVREKAEWRLGGTLIVVEGVGVRPDNPADTVHHAFGVITYNPWVKQYNVRAYKAEGLYVDAPGEVLPDGALEWRIENPYVGIMKNTARLMEDGSWVETGKQSRDGGENWTHFFEMQLSKMK